MNIVTKGVFVSYQTSYPAASPALQSWYTIASKAEWSSPEDVKQFDPKASILKDGRVVFDIMGGKYRLIVRINYQKQWIYLRFFGTHQEYDKVDANTV
jgi:mRNA interferase HigB